MDVYVYTEPAKRRRMKSNGRERAITIKDIAREANVSYATVSRALSGNQNIREDTRQRILEISEKMGYTANAAARSMVMRETRLLGILLPNIDNPFMSELAYHMECYARARGYTLMLCNTSHDVSAEENAFLMLLGRQVDGIIIFPSSADSYYLLEKYFDKVPTVFVNENLVDAPQSYVAVDNYKGTRMGTEYLLSLGHRHIVYLGRRQTSTTHQLRAQGYVDVCKENDITPLFVDSPSDDTTIEIGYSLALPLFQNPRGFTAIFANADTLALGVLQAADECGVQIPDDCSLLGFDNIRYSELPKINLTTIEQPKEAMAMIATDMLLEKIQNEYEAYSHRILAPTLIERSSCKEFVSHPD